MTKIYLIYIICVILKHNNFLVYDRPKIKSNQLQKFWKTIALIPCLWEQRKTAMGNRFQSKQTNFLTCIKKRRLVNFPRSHNQTFSLTKFFIFTQTLDVEKERKIKVKFNMFATDRISTWSWEPSPPQQDGGNQRLSWRGKWKISLWWGTNANCGF